MNESRDPSQPCPAATEAPPATAVPLLQRRDIVGTALALFCLLPLLLSWLRRPAGQSHQPPALPGPLRFQTDINRAPLSELTLLPGIGPQLGARIVRDRQQNGPFRSLEELQRVPGIGPKTLEQLAPMVIIGPVVEDPEGDPAAINPTPDPRPAGSVSF